MFVARQLSPGADPIDAREIGCVFGSMRDNIYLSESEIALAEEMMPPDEVKGRVYGLFSFREGVVYADFNERMHCYAQRWPIPGEWTCDEIIDPGWDNPCAVLFGAVDHAGTRFCYDEIYERQRTVGQIAALIQAKRWEQRGLLTPRELQEFRAQLARGSAADDLAAQAADDERIKELLAKYRQRLGEWRPRAVWIDEYGRQRDQAKPVSLIKQFRAFGIEARPASNRDKMGQRQKVREALRPLDGVVRLKIGLHCNWLRWEFKHFRMEERNEITREFHGDRERVRDAHNHLMSCLEYWLSSDPQFAPPEAGAPEPGTIMARHQELIRQKYGDKPNWRRKG